MTEPAAEPEVNGNEDVKRDDLSESVRRMELTNERQRHLFGFSPLALPDMLFNWIGEGWQKGVEELVNSPLLPKEMRVEARAKLKEELQTDLYLNSTLEQKCDEMKSWVQQNVFNIPDHVTLPEYRAALELTKWDVDATDLERKIRNKEREIREKRRRLALLAHEFKEGTIALELMSVMKRQANTLIGKEEESEEDEEDEEEESSQEGTTTEMETSGHSTTTRTGNGTPSSSANE